jgi:hypothetical protein
MTHSAEEETVMPALLWVAFWSAYGDCRMLR